MFSNLQYCGNVNDVQPDSRLNAVVSSQYRLPALGISINRQEQMIPIRSDLLQCQCVLCNVRKPKEQESIGKLEMKQRIGYRVAWLCKVNIQRDAVLQHVLLRVLKLTHWYDFA